MAMRVFLTETRNTLSIEAQQNFAAFVDATLAALFHYSTHAQMRIAR